jgi:hypothetical protein
MATPYILLIVAAIFFLVALVRLGRDGWRIVPATRTWLLVAVIFTAVAVWLFLK